MQRLNKTKPRREFRRHKIRNQYSEELKCRPEDLDLQTCMAATKKCLGILHTERYTLEKRILDKHTISLFHTEFPYPVCLPREKLS